MKKILFVFIALVCFTSAIDAKKPKKKVDPKNWVESIEWDSPERGDKEAFNAIYDSGDSLYAYTMALADSIAFYELKTIVNSDTGDSIVCLVDGNGVIRGTKSAWERTSASVTLISKYTIFGLGLVNQVKAIPKRQLLSLDGLVMAGAISQILNMYTTVTGDLLSGLKQQKAAIKAFDEYQKSVQSGNPDASLLDNTGFVYDSPENIISKSDAQILSETNIAKSEDINFGENYDFNLDS